jgi:hypothetical protein
MAGPKVEVIRVGEQDADVEILGEIALRESLTVARADGHEHGRFDITVSGGSTPARARDRTFCLISKLTAARINLGRAVCVVSYAISALANPWRGRSLSSARVTTAQYVQRLRQL